MGLLTHRIILALGLARETVVVAKTRANEALARAGGCDEFVITADAIDAAELVKASVVFDVTGDPSAIDVAISACRQGGRIILLGSPRGVTRFPSAAFRQKGLRLVGAHTSLTEQETSAQGVDVRRRDVESYLALLASGEVKVDDLVTRVVAPRDVDRFYRDLVASHLLSARFDWSDL